MGPSSSSTSGGAAAAAGGGGAAANMEGREGLSSFTPNSTEGREGREREMKQRT
ncbi:MAG: hypothetical protein MJE68_31970 [Proteobacteria bacterium]|nr:hypothetical protein [Pseudomonadota bacterium]